MAHFEAGDPLVAIIVSIAISILIAETLSVWLGVGIAGICLFFLLYPDVRNFIKNS